MPLIAGDGLPPTGAPMGFDVLSGGSFYCDPMGWMNDDTIPVTNPNVFIFGKPVRGKSALVKVFMLRMIRFGYRSLVLGDVKDEYKDIPGTRRGAAPDRIFDVVVAGAGAARSEVRDWFELEVDPNPDPDVVIDTAPPPMWDASYKRRTARAVSGWQSQSRSRHRRPTRCR